MRFRCLTRQRHLMYLPNKCSMIITACTILHNMCRQSADAEYLDNPDEYANDELDESDTDKDHDAHNDIPEHHLPRPNDGCLLQLGRRNQQRIMAHM